jgi:hypothetical protein
LTLTFRSFAATLALVAMLARAFLPQGWMPQAEGGPLVICSVDGAHLSVPGHAPARDGQDEHGYVCPFAAAAHLAPPSHAPDFAPALAVAFLAPTASLSAPIAASRDRRHPPRGPPLPV